MKLFAEDGYFQPKSQVRFGIGLAILSLLIGIVDLVGPSTMFDQVTGVISLLAVPVWIYAAWYGYRKMLHQQAAASNPGARLSESRPRKSPLIPAAAGLASTPVFGWLAYRSGAPVWMAVLCGCTTAIILLAVLLFVWRAIKKAQGSSD